MHQLKWAAVPLTAVAIVLLFFGMIWQSAVQGAVAIALLAIAAGTWRAATGKWPPPISS